MSNLKRKTTDLKEIIDSLNFDDSIFKNINIENVSNKNEIKNEQKDHFLIPNTNLLSRKPLLSLQLKQNTEPFENVNKRIKFNDDSSEHNDMDNAYDAFKQYLLDDKETKNTQSSELSQFFQNSENIEKIDNIIDNNSETKGNDDILKSFERFFNGSDSITKNRENVDKFFDKMEQTITAMGTSNLEIPDELFDNLVSIDTPTKSQIENNLPKTQNLDNSLSHNTSTIDASFGSVLKKALLANASKNIVHNISLEASIKDTQILFNELGSFYGLPNKVRDLIKLYKGIDNLYEWQDECLKLPAIKERKNLIYALPTSGGKTLVAEILMLREILCYKKNVLFILPFVAIVQEKVWSLSPFAVALDFLIDEYSASKGTYPPRKRRRKNSLYIATIEKASGLINSLIETDRLNEIGLIVVDELHLIGEPQRGPVLETLLTKLLLIDSKIQIIGMSATIGNIKDISQFLNAEVYLKNFRPIELIEYIKCGSEIAKINSSKKDEELFTVVRKTEFNYSEVYKSIDPDGIGGLVMEVIPDEACLVFCATKRNCENVASLLCRIVDRKLLEYKKLEKEQIKHALKDESGSLCKILNKSIHFGIAYHHSGLTNEERHIIEDSFRAGIISVICCTSTLAAGVNLPAKRVILRQPYIGREFINLSRYKQMIGRAGRAGLGEIGESIIICSSQDLDKVKNLLTSPMDQALSNMHEYDSRGFRHLCLSCISLNIANTRQQLQDITKKTLLSVQCNQLNVNLKKLTDSVIKDLFKLGALESDELNEIKNNSNITIKLDSTFNSTLSDEEKSVKKKVTIQSNSKLKISRLGYAAIKGHFDLSRAHLLYDDLYQAQKSLVLLDCLHLLYLVTPYDTAEQIKPNKTNYYNIFCKLGPNQMQTAKIIGLNDSVALKLLSNQQIKALPERVLNRFYLTLMLYELWNEAPVFQVAEKFQIDRGIVQNLMTGAATFATNVVNFCEGLDEFWSFSHLLKGMSLRLSHCCVKELLSLMELPAVKQNRARQLYNAGYKNLQCIAKATPDDLVRDIEFLPRRVANQLIAASKMLLLEKVENLREEAEDILEGNENQKLIGNYSVLR